MNRVFWMGLAGIALPRSAMAWEPLFVCAIGDEQTWEGTQLDLAVSDFSFTPAEEDAIIDAAESWDASVVGQSYLEVTAAIDTTLAVFDNNDGVNLIARSSHPTVTGGTLGWAEIRGKTCFLSLQELVEVDIHLNGTPDWSEPSYYYDLCDADWDAEVFFLDDTVRHEVGHGLGLAHVGYGDVKAPGEYLATMFLSYQGSMNTGENHYIAERPHVVSEDDREGVRDLYPLASPPVIDVAVQSYLYDDTALAPDECRAPSRPSPPTTDLTEGAFNAGMSLGSCPINRDDECVSISVPPGPLPAAPGAVELFEFTLLNLGPDTVVDVGFRLVLTWEDDSTPTTGYVLHEGTVTLTPNTPFEVTREVTIPNAPTGLYYVVAQLDPDDLLVEDDELNNEAIYNQQIEIVSGCGGCASGGLSPGWTLVGVLTVLRRSRRTP